MSIESGKIMEGRMALDMQGLERLKHSARKDPSGTAAEEAAQQFEAMFVQMMVKSMRDAVPESGMLSSSQGDMYQDMLDKQWSQTIASRGIGLADTLVDELKNRGIMPQSQGEGGEAKANSLIAGIPRGAPKVLRDAIIPSEEGADSSRRADDAGAASGAGVDEAVDGFMSQIAVARSANQKAAEASQGFMAAIEAKASPETDKTASAIEDVQAGKQSHTNDSGDRPGHVRAFLDRLSQPAQAASKATGVPAELILAQAALETGWGEREISTRDGGNSHNLFGIKAGAGWKGDTTVITTHEYRNGQRQQVRDEFRVYDSFEDAFTDYADLISKNPRYTGVTDAQSAPAAAHALQTGGYATDPRYADKLISVMNTMGTQPNTGTQPGEQQPARNLAFLDAIR